MRVQRKTVVLLALLAVFPVGPARADITISTPYVGVTRIDRTETVPRPVNMHIVLVDLTAPGIGFKVTGHSGARETTRQTTLNFLNQEHAQIAVNSHFFSTDSTTDAWLTGLAVSNGNVYSSFDPQPAAAGQPNQSYAIIPYAPALNIDAENHASIVHRDPSDNNRVLEPVTLWNAIAGSAQIITDGVKTIPTYEPTGPLSNLNGYSNSDSWYNRVRARTAIGLTHDNKTLVLFTVDERPASGAGASNGMTVGEVADILMNLSDGQHDYHVDNALNLDGGGSTTLAVQDPATRIGAIINVSSDNPLGRAVGSNLAVFAQPMPRTWTNGAATWQWNDAGNWSPRGAPDATTDVSFGNSGLTDGATIDLGGNRAVNSLTIESGVRFTVGGSGTLTLAKGTLVRSSDSSGVQTFAQPIALGANASWDIAGNGQILVSSPVSGAFSLEKKGTGTLVFSGANTYTGSTTISAGTLQIGVGGTSGELGGSGDITDGGTLVFSRSDSVSLSRTVKGTGGLVQAGPGTLTLSAANTYSGGTAVVAGTLRVDAPDAFPSGGSLTIDADGSVVLQSGLAGSAVSAAAIPEPSTLALLGIGALGLLAWGWRRPGRLASVDH